MPTVFHGSETTVTKNVGVLLAGAEENGEGHKWNKIFAQ